ncbi:MAG: zinc-ribbon domain-containing protein [Fibromonadaceae bacterium]|jgi:uncharacterized protein (TIGR02145 family)|nr:zinc-ribbon domain-containing protein [Fibromonadaceae bacterium]
MLCSNCKEKLENYMNFCPYCGTKVSSSSDIFTDPRDRNVYKTVKIGNQIWMARNLTYAAEGSKCYEKKYGRLYNWTTAKNACPAGWHLPTNKEWLELVVFAGGVVVAGKNLKTKHGWDDFGNGLDVFDFAALPAGLGDSEGYFDDTGYSARWWTASEINSQCAYSWGMDYDFDGAHWSSDNKSSLFSIRCLQNL